MSKGVYKLHFDCGRMGMLNGLFIADTKEMEEAKGKEVYFGEVLGKHSEIYGPLEQKDFTLITTDQKVVSLFEEHDLETGYNPLDYIRYEEEEDE